MSGKTFLIPLALIALACTFAALMAYGAHPAWVQHSWGLSVIMFSRRFQWPLIFLALLPCFVLLALVISGKRRVWWLIGLAPVMALFVHRFLTDPINRYAIADEPKFVAAADATFMSDQDEVFGLVFHDQAFAYPYACLAKSPVVVQSDREHRLLLTLNPGANMATALEVARELKARELDIASLPAGALLLYNSRWGQFICGVTGLTPRGEKPSGVESRLTLIKTTWRNWKAQQPDTRIMLPISGVYRGSTVHPPRVFDGLEYVLIGGGSSPVAISTGQITATPLNLTEGNIAALVFRDAATGRVKAFDRHIDADLVPQFKLSMDKKRKTPVLIDSDTNSSWTVDGRYVDGHPDFKAKRLSTIEVQEGVDLAAVRFWYPNLKLHQPTTRTSITPG